MNNTYPIPLYTITKEFIFSKKETMNDRPNDFLRIRPEIKKTVVFANMSMEERFQNETLRPILKLQNSLLLLVFGT